MTSPEKRIDEQYEASHLSGLHDKTRIVRFRCSHRSVVYVAAGPAGSCVALRRCAGAAGVEARGAKGPVEYYVIDHVEKASEN